MRNPGEEIDLRIFGERAKGIAVRAEDRDALLPRAGAGRRGTVRPVVGRPRHLLVLRISTEVEDVVLREAEMLEYLPGRVFEPLGSLSLQLEVELGHGGIRRGVGLAEVDELGELLAKCLSVRHGYG